MHQNYDYEQLCDEIESFQRDEDESIVDFDLRNIQNYYIFHCDDWPLKQDFDPLRLSLIHNSLSKFEKERFFGELDSNKFEPHIFFGELIVIPYTKDVFLPNIDSPNNNEIIHEAPHPKTMVSSNSPLLTHVGNGVYVEVEQSNIYRFNSNIEVIVI